ncbi:MAG: uracil-DNA glycosylase [Actinobacteria bacterium]|nr:uracil-DNA glycosylase [Actinomycetota bacterium]
MEALQKLKDSALNCQKCKLHEYRTQVVFGVGNPDADLMFIGEAPGYNEDVKGEPFVGAAGKLLDKVIFEETGLTRNQIYITNVVKCRPPNNRNPEEDEIVACNPYLLKQIELIKPKVICALGNFAARTLLGKNEGISKLRGRIFISHGIKVVPTFHPAAILRNPNLIDTFREDIKLVHILLNEPGEEKDSSKKGEEFEQPSLF